MMHIIVPDIGKTYLSASPFRKCFKKLGKLAFN